MEPIDLSREITHRMQGFPTHPPVIRGGTASPIRAVALIGAHGVPGGITGARA